MKHQFGVRLCFSVLGIYIMTIGIAFSCLANLGTSPISSVPWVMSLFTPWSVGEITIAMNLIMIFVQPILLRGFYYRELLLQLVTTFFFGNGIDFSMHVFRWLKPTSLMEQWALCFLSIVVLALGVYLAVSARVFLAAGEGLVNVIAFATKIKFSIVKNVLDISLVLISLFMTMMEFGYLNGIGLGTVVAAIGVGRCVQFYTNHLPLPIKKYNNR